MKEITRDQWGAKPPKKSYSKNIDIKGLAVHYSAMAAPKNELEEIQQLKNIQKFHQVDRGWNDIAYSFLVGDSGNLYVGRGFGNRPASQGTNDGNKQYYSVCWLGGENDTTSNKALKTIKNLLKEIGGQLKPHSEFKATNCPDDFLRDWIIQVQKPVDNKQKEHIVLVDPIKQDLDEIKDELKHLQAEIKALRQTWILKGFKAE